MVYIVCALYNEAKPFIDFYGLKRYPGSKYFQVFSNDKVQLVISGIGKINSACAVSYLLSNRELKRSDIIINIGICGSRKRKIGDAFIIDRIKDMDSGREYYPDMLVKNNFEEAYLETFSRIINNEVIEDLCDMEGSGFIEAASKFLSPHQIQLVKVVSDAADGSTIAGENVAKLISESVENINEYIGDMQKAYGDYELISDEEKGLVDDISQNLRLTACQMVQLKKAYREYKIKEGKKAEFLCEFLNVQVKVKNDAKKEFGRLIKMLSE